MATKTRASAGPTTLKSGPWKGVRTTNDPYDDPPDLLVDAKNIYIPDPEGASGVYARPGFSLALGGQTLTVWPSFVPSRGQCIHSHVALDGTRYNYAVYGGNIFRLNAALTSATFVTPTSLQALGNISTTNRVTMISVLDKVGVTDQEHQPWYFTTPNASPLDFTLIQYNPGNDFWTAKAPFYFGGSAFWPLIQVNNIARGEDVSWSEPGLIQTGYEQATFDDNWTLISANPGIIYAGVGTNNGFYFFRQNSIGLATGTVTSDLATTATLDAISYDVGSLSPQCIHTFGSSIFFVDAFGRPWRLVPGNPPEAIWLQLRGVFQTAQVSSPERIARQATACIVPTLNLYIVAVWNSDISTSAAPTKAYVFDARTGTYEGFWTVADTGQGGVGIECLGVVVDDAGREQVLVIATGGYIYSMNPVASPISALLTQDGQPLLTQAKEVITIQGIEPNWLDAGEVPDIYAMTGRLGYADDVVHMVDQATITTLTDSPTRVTVQASMTPSSVEGQPEPSASQDGTFRMVCGFEAFGRGPQLTVKPLELEEQWALERISITTIPSTAGPEDA